MMSQRKWMARNLLVLSELISPTHTFSVCLPLSLSLTHTHTNTLKLTLSNLLFFLYFESS